MQTERILIRQWQDSDLDAFCKINADPKVCHHLPSVLSNSESVKQFEQVINCIEKNGFGPWACELKKDGTMIEMAGFFNNTKICKLKPATELIWRFDSNYWGQGFATEVAKKIIEIGFLKFGFVEHVAYTVPANIASIVVMEKIGLKRDESLNFNHPEYPTEHPLSQHIVYRLTLQEWNNEKSKLIP